MLESKRFAAIVPICGGLDVSSAFQAGALKNGGRRARGSGKNPRAHSPVDFPDADTIIPVQESRAMVRALEAAGANARYTEYPRVGHDSWDRAYAEEELPRWLFAQRRAM